MGTWSTPVSHMLPHLHMRNVGPQLGGGTRLAESEPLTRLAGKLPNAAQPKADEYVRVRISDCLKLLGLQGLC